MDERAAHLISTLELAPHPEGGHFREVYRSPGRVRPADGRSERAALTTIYFLLVGGEVSRWHRVASDEIWHYYEGDQLQLLTADPRFGAVRSHVLGPMGEGRRPFHVVEAGWWQAARSTGAHTLVGCTVGPGFEFEDFEMLRDRSEAAEALKHRHPEWSEFV